MTDPAERCSNCQHWHRQASCLAGATRNIRGNPQVGACQLYPPDLVQTEWFPVSMYPETHESRNCGSWEQRYPEWKPDDGEEAPVLNTVVPFERVAS